MRKAKIVATLGPASNSPEKLRALLLAGVEQFNFESGERLYLVRLRGIGGACRFDQSRCGDGNAEQDDSREAHVGKSCFSQGEPPKGGAKLPRKASVPHPAGESSKKG